MKPPPIPPSIFKPLKKVPDCYALAEKIPSKKLDVYLSSKFISTYFSNK